MFRVAFPVLLRVTVCAALVEFTGALAKVRLVGLRTTMGELPCPTRLIKCGDPAASSPNRMVPNRDPGAVGVKVTVKVQTPAGGTEEPQSSFSAKSPVSVLVAMFKAAVPILRRTAVRGVLVVPTLRVENCTSEGLTVKAGAAT